MTEGKLNFLSVLSSYVNTSIEKHQLEDFHKCMRNAIVQDHYDALLTLLWLASRLSEQGKTWSSDDSLFEPPEELFPLIARQGIRVLTGTLDGCSARFFKLLLHTHVESMPVNHSDIEEWASQLLTNETRGVKAFATWILNWSKKKRCSGCIYRRSILQTGVKREIGTIMFQGGCLSRSKRRENMAEKYKNTWRGGVPRLTEKVVEGVES